MSARIKHHNKIKFYKLNPIQAAVGLLRSPKHKKSFRLRPPILGDPGADSGNEEKSKRAQKYGTKKSKERREEPLGTMSYHQSDARTAATVWNWSGKTLSPGALLAVLYFSSCHIFPPV